MEKRMKKAIAIGVLVFAASTAFASARLNFYMSLIDVQLNTCKTSILNGNSDICQKTKNDAADTFKEKFGGDIANPKVKAMFAQWMTAMDTAGTRLGQAEEAKFHTLMNELKLD